MPLKLAEGSVIHNTKHKCTAANRTTISIIGTTTLSGVIGGKRINITGLVSNDVQDVLLGVDWLKENRAVLDFNKGEVYIHGQPFKLRMRKNNATEHCGKVDPTEDVTVSVRQQRSRDPVTTEAEQRLVNVHGHQREVQDQTRDVATNQDTGNRTGLENPPVDDHLAWTRHELIAYRQQEEEIKYNRELKKEHRRQPKWKQKPSPTVRSVTSPTRPKETSQQDDSAVITNHQQQNQLQEQQSVESPTDATQIDVSQSDESARTHRTIRRRTSQDQQQEQLEKAVDEVIQKRRCQQLRWLQDYYQ